MMFEANPIDMKNIKPIKPWLKYINEFQEAQLLKRWQ